MTHQCEICQYIEQVKTPDKSEDKNTCYSSLEESRLYQPFPKNDEAILVTCTNFSHIHTGKFTLRGGKKLTIQATKKEPNVMLALQRQIGR